MVPGQVGADGGSAARAVEEVGERETGNVQHLYVGGGLVVGRHFILVTVEMMAVLVRITF